MKFVLIITMIFLTACSFSEEPKQKEKSADEINTKVIKRNSLVETEFVLGEAYTSVIEQGANRVSNILLACGKISGMKLSPGEEFSFNNITGRKTAANGYKNAPVIVDGEKSYGIGGGVCQVSTTIYMAALNAEMQITEHHNHSESVAYAPGGTDATVVYGVKDFKFINNTEDNVYIYVWAEEDKVFCKIIKKSSYNN